MQHLAMIKTTSTRTKLIKKRSKKWMHSIENLLLMNVCKSKKIFLIILTIVLRNSKNWLMWNFKWTRLRFVRSYKDMRRRPSNRKLSLNNLGRPKLKFKKKMMMYFHLAATVILTPHLRDHLPILQNVLLL